jgi:hypothetical protein
VDCATVRAGEIEMQSKNILKHFPILKEFFGSGLIETESKWAKFDFYDESSLYELKSRKVKKNTYPTTIITANKNNDNRDDKKVVFITTARRAALHEEVCIKIYTPIHSYTLLNTLKRSYMTTIGTTTA